MNSFLIKDFFINEFIMENNIHNFRINGIKFLDYLTEKDIETMLKKSNDAFFNNVSIITDNEYDIIKEFMQNKFPNNKTIKQIGAKVNGKKVKLPYFMPSMDKIKPQTNALDKWKMKFKGQYIITPKLDGVSGLYSTENGTSKLYTRGNGEYGQDISYIIPYMSLPSEPDLTIRGEFIIKKTLFHTKYAENFSNPRNFVSGVINSKEADVEKLTDIDFVPYEIINPVMKPFDQVYKLDKLFPTTSIPYYYLPDINNTLLSKNLVYFRNELCWECDGIIITNNDIYPRSNKNPIHSFAFKMILEDQIAEAKVVNVLWSASKDGYLKPKIQIEPIELCGVTITYATAFNAGFVLNNKLGVGAIVKIIRSGDVIPYIMETTVPAEHVLLPNIEESQMEWINNIELRLINNNDEVRLKNIVYFFTTLGIEGLSKGNVIKIINHGYNDVSKIIKMTVDNFLEIDGFKHKMANKLYNSIKDTLENVELPLLMQASNIFGHGFAEKKFKIILTEKPDILTCKETNQDKISIIENMSGMAEKTAIKFVENIESFIKFIHEIDLQDKLKYTTGNSEESSHLQNHELYKKNIVFTGCRPTQVINTLESNFKVNIQNTVNKNTDILVCKSIHDTSSKMKNAQSHNVTIMSIEQFVNKFNNI